MFDLWACIHVLIDIFYIGGCFAAILAGVFSLLAKISPLIPLLLLVLFSILSLTIISTIHAIEEIHFFVQEHQNKLPRKPLTLQQRSYLVYATYVPILGWYILFKRVTGPILNWIMEKHVDGSPNGWFIFLNLFVEYLCAIVWMQCVQIAVKGVESSLEIEPEVVID